MTERLRIGVNALFLRPGEISGTGFYTWELIRKLIARDDITIVVFAQGGSVPDDLRSSVEVVRCPRFRSVAARVAYEQIVLPARVKRRHLDVLWSTAYVVPLLARVPQVVTIHDLYYRRAPEAVAGIRRHYFKLMVPASARRARVVLVGAERTAEDLAEVVGAEVVQRVRVVRHGVRDELAQIEPVAPDIQAPYVLVVAAATANKRVDLVVEAVERLRDQGTDAMLVVAGADPHGLVDALRAGRERWLIHYAVVTEAELAGLYRNASVYVTASAYEGFGLTVLEAQLLGAPVICSQGGALPEVAGFGAMYPPELEPAAFANCMAVVLSDREVADQLRAAGERNVAKFSWDAAASETMDVLWKAAT